MKKIEKTFNSETKILAIIVIICIIVSVIIFSFVNSKNYSTIIGGTDEKKFKNEYEKLNDKLTEDGKKYPEVKLPSNNLIKYSNVEEVYNIFKNKENAVIYFGYATCLYCRSAIEVLCNAATNTSLDVIYYLEIEENTDYSRLFEFLDERFVIENNGKKEIYTPLVIFIADGRVVSYNKGTLFSQEDPYMELTESQKRGLSEIYSYGIKDVMNAIELKKKYDKKS